MSAEPVVILITIDVPLSRRESLIAAIEQYISEDLTSMRGFDRSWLCERDGGLLNIVRWHDADAYDRYLGSASSARIRATLAEAGAAVRMDRLKPRVVGLGPEM